VSTHRDPPADAISYEQWLLDKIAYPGMICGPPVIDDRALWQQIPWLNPYRELQRRVRVAELQPEPESGLPTHGRPAGPARKPRRADRYLHAATPGREGQCPP
jgi:hypothetical protein